MATASFKSSSMNPISGNPINHPNLAGGVMRANRMGAGLGGGEDLMNEGRYVPVDFHFGSQDTSLTEDEAGGFGVRS